MWSPTWLADRVTMALPGLLLAWRSSGPSMPWSTALRTRWTRGSLRSSIMVLSSSVSSPDRTSSTSLPSWRARSRARRGYFWNSRPIGCMRVFITAFCKSETRRSSWLTARSSALMVSGSVLPWTICDFRLLIRFLVRPISPDRLSTWSRRAVSMRIVVSFCRLCWGWGAPPEGGRTACGSATAAGTGAGAGVGAEATGMAWAIDMPLEQAREQALELGIEVHPDWGVGKIVSEAFEARAEPGLWQPTVVMDYPKEISPLARDHRSQPGLVERFEVIVAGRELANAFSELNDPLEQRRRFEAQAAARAR
ncbi:MAG: hypothetical protein HGA75_18870, partial [Thiobacillus sp.]|nr:hypothetical protein [Thiobacillus sp.]